MKLYMFRTVPLSIIRSLFTVHSAIVYVIQVCVQLSNRTRMKLAFHYGPARDMWRAKQKIIFLHFLSAQICGELKRTATRTKLLSARVTPQATVALELCRAFKN
jgi:hypothetical protein